jgi:hypothetical protein
VSALYSCTEQVLSAHNEQFVSWVISGKVSATISGTEEFFDQDELFVYSLYPLCSMYSSYSLLASLLLLLTLLLLLLPVLNSEQR